MVKLINEPIQVYEPVKNKIRAFIWRKRLYSVIEIIGWWREASSWWDNEPLRFFIRVQASNYSQGTYELCRIEKQWYMHRVLD